MPRVNRLARAVEHPNPVVGCIMVIQEKIRFLGRALVHCRCPEYETEMAQLRADLSELREQFQAQRLSLRRLQVHGQETLARYRQRITTLLRANARQMSLRRNQLLAVSSEIGALRETIQSLRCEVVRCNGNIPSPNFSPWELSLTHIPVTWVVSPLWQDHHPGEVPDFNPNMASEEDVSSKTMP